MENIDQLKEAPSRTARVKYRLRDATVFVSPGGHHFTDYLDPVEGISPEIDASALTGEERRYIEGNLQSNAERFRAQAELVARYVDPRGARVLDIGCGGGLFLSLLEERAAEVVGIELSDSRAEYARSVHGIKVFKLPVERAFWREGYAGFFDVVTLWDVIEHVNYPLRTLRAAADLLRDGGHLMIDTPCRNSLYHRFGAMTYRLSRGRYPTLLNAMYADQPFGHKQIFSRAELEGLLGSAGLEVLELRTFRELSFPLEHYLRRLIPSETGVRFAAPLARALLALARVRNKMVAVARKGRGEPAERCPR